MTDRKEVFLEHQSFFTMSTLTDALSKAEEALKGWKFWVRRSSYHLFYPVFPQFFDVPDNPFAKTLSEESKLEDYMHDLPTDYYDNICRLTEWYTEVVGLDIWVDDPISLVEECTDELMQFQYDEMLTLEEAKKLLNKVESFKDSVLIEEAEAPKYDLETAGSIVMLRTLLGAMPLAKTSLK